jgi:hypothetical protein
LALSSKKINNANQFQALVPVSLTNETDSQDITEILLKVALNNMTLTITSSLKVD